MSDIYDAGFDNLLTRELESGTSDSTLTNPIQPSQILKGSLDLGRIQILPDENTGLVATDDNDAEIFKIITDGTDVGDVIIGDYDGGEGIKYDKSASSFLLSLSSSDAIVIDYGSDILLKHGGDVKFTSVTTPTACTATLVATDTGNVDAGDHIYKVTYVNEHGETELGAASNTVTTDATHLQVDLSDIPVSTSGSVTDRKIYRTKAGGSNYYLLTTIADNTTTTYTDNTADADLTGGAANNRVNDSFGKIIIDSKAVFNIASLNTFVGEESGIANVGGYNDTFIGRQTGYSNTSGNSNIFVGALAGYSNVSGHYNVFIGDNAGYGKTKSSGHVFIGYWAGNKAGGTEGSDNTFIGFYAGSETAAGYRNTFIGAHSGYSNTTGHYNVALGRNAGYSNSTGDDNIFLGQSAGKYETGSQAFYVNNQSRTDTAGDKAKSLMYGVMAAATADQKLKVNAIESKSVQAGITAFAGGGQADAVLLTANIVEIATCATAGDSVKLPVIAAEFVGMQIVITNHGAAACDVFPNTGEYINEAAVDTAKSVAIDASMLCSAWDADNWECVTLAR